MPWKPTAEDEVPTLGWYVIDWMTELLAAPARVDFEPFVPTLEQEDFILGWYEIVPETGRFRRQRGLLGRPRGWGKSPILGALALCEALGDVLFDGWDADGQPVGRPWSTVRTPLVHVAAVSELQPLALDTPVRTPNGRRTVGDLEIGDLVFDSCGMPVPVSRMTPIMSGQDCYRVTFDDGESIVASGSHGWTLERLHGHGDRYETVTATTEEIARTVANTKGRKRYRVPLVAEQGVHNDALPIDPYLLGLWLGDGSKSDSTIAIDWRSRDELNHILGPLIEPYETIIHKFVSGNTGVMRVRRTPGICRRGHLYGATIAGSTVEQQGNLLCRVCRRTRGAAVTMPTFRERLRAAGVLGRKHIPDQYLRASYDQRLELLRGLVDSDGHVSAKGRASFVNADTRLFDQVCELLTSLGFRWSVTRAEGTARRVHWQPRPNEHVAKLPNKVARHLDEDSPRSRSRHRWIVSVDQVPSVPVRCIGIDTDDHLFLAGERNTLTHNTKNTWQPLVEMLHEDAPIHDEHPGIEPFDSAVNLPHGSINKITRAPRTAKGAPTVFAVLDQTEEWVPSTGGPTLAQYIRTNCDKNGGRTIESPNAFIPGEQSVAEMSFDYAQAISEGRVRYDGLLYDVREAPGDTDLTERESLLAGLRYVYGDASDHPDGCVLHDPPCPPGWAPVESHVEKFWDPAYDVQILRADFLNQQTHASDSWITRPQWRARNVDEMDAEDLGDFQPIKPGDVITLGFDGSQGRKKGKADATALIGCRVRDGHLFTIRVWEQPDGKAGKGWEVPVDEVLAEVKTTFDTYRVVGFLADPSGWKSQVAAWEAKYGRRLKVKSTQQAPIAAWPRQKDVRIVEWVKSLHDAIVNGECTHDGSGPLTRHVLNARRRSTRQGYLLYKAYPDSPNKIDGAYAATLAWRARLLAVAKGLGKPPADAKRTKTRALVLSD